MNSGGGKVLNRKMMVPTKFPVSSLSYINRIIVVLSREAYQGSTRGPDAVAGVVGHNMRLRWCWHKGKVRSAKCFPPSDNTIPPQASGVIHRSSPAEVCLAGSLVPA